MKELIEAVCDRVRKTGVQFMDVRIVEDSCSSICMDRSIISSVSSDRGLAAGIRVLEDDAWGFAGTSKLDCNSLFEALDNARDMARASRIRVLDPGIVSRAVPIVDEIAEPCEISPASIPIEVKIQYLTDQDNAARSAYNSSISNCGIRWRDDQRRTSLGNTFGTRLTMERTLSFITADVLAEGNGRRYEASVRRGLLGGWELAEQNPPEVFSLQAARRATELLKAAPSPCGRMPVILSPSVAGLFIHEALGHNSEADWVHGGRSILDGMIGEEIASPLVSVYDDSTLPGAHGSFQYDDEGVPGSKRVLVENGVLKGFLHSLETAARFGVEPTGSARASNAFTTPIVRMSNTYISPGDSSLDEMIRSIDRGLYLRHANAGFVQPEKGEFNLNVGDAVMVRNGEIAEPVTGVILNGLILETLKSIDCVASDFSLGRPSYCGKNSQSIPVDGGGPHVRVGEMLVGGSYRGMVK